MCDCASASGSGRTRLHKNRYRQTCPGGLTHPEHLALHKKRYLSCPHIPAVPPLPRSSPQYPSRRHTSGPTAQIPLPSPIVTRTLSRSRTHNNRYLWRLRKRPAQKPVPSRPFCYLHNFRYPASIYQSEWEDLFSRTTNRPSYRIRRADTSHAHKPLPLATAFAQKSLP
jgi:hypothetical protein